MFLPLADRGIDALVHRLSDGVYLPVQAKSRSVLVDGEVHLVVWADSLQDDRALLVGAAEAWISLARSDSGSTASFT